MVFSGMDNQNYLQTDASNHITFSPSTEQWLDDILQGPSPPELQEHMGNNNYNQITDNLPGSLDNITNQAGSGLQDEQNITFSIPHFSLTQNALTEQPVELEHVQNVRCGNVPIRSWKTLSLIFFVGEKFINGLKQEMVTITVPGFDIQFPSNMSLDDMKVEFMKWIEASLGNNMRFELRIPDEMSTYSNISTRTYSPDKQHTTLKRMVTITVSEFDLQFPSNKSFDDMKVEVMKMLEASLGNNTHFELRISDEMSTYSNISIRTYSPDKQQITLKRKHPQQDEVVPRCIRKKVFNVPSVKSLNCASTSSPSSSSPQTQNCTKFTEEEIELLLRGVEEHGVGDWLELKKRCFNQSSRTNRQLQEKLKNLVKTARSYSLQKKKKCSEKFADFYRRVLVVIGE